VLGVVRAEGRSWLDGATLADGRCCALGVARADGRACALGVARADERSVRPGATRADPASRSDGVTIRPDGRADAPARAPALLAGLTRAELDVRSALPTLETPARVVGAIRPDVLLATPAVRSCAIRVLLAWAPDAPARRTAVLVDDA
jgi:hypothetical protein